MIPFIGKHSPYDIDDLEQKLLITYDRCTLVDNLMNEKITLDSNLRFSNGKTEYSNPELHILELKQNERETALHKQIIKG